MIYPSHATGSEKLPLVLFNDGQDFSALQLMETLEQQYRAGYIPPVVVAGIHAGKDRLAEYGVAAKTDYAGRGSRAGATTDFVLHELLPYLVSQFPVNVRDVSYAGFSLGGLMALDMAWNHPGTFRRVGVFSGSLWWRERALHEGYSDRDRIMHAQIRNSPERPDLKFWFQCGTMDEADDRDQDGVIDSIQDTLECISELERKGYTWGSDIIYREVAGGIHAPLTWSQVMPDFLRWVTAAL
ncbi:esterase family protein [Dyadobacter sandarakinus]|uniref:Esterase family protein n=2 Tax=Dyadobacter sandarakinus TaxID=2747268 RepID=A0ABX7IDL8_9BACT|nr:esterase family protein [Dyadobacter sandarakinus]